jgi:DNA-nicking Smr family endonuclease
MHITLDLHGIYNKGAQIETALQNVLADARKKKLDYVEIIPGKGSGALKKTVLRFFNKKAVRSQYSRLDVDNKNFGRLFIHFNWKKLSQPK